MDAGTLNIQTIFGQDRRHIVPLFQRPYVWKEEVQWGPLWEDITSLAESVNAGSVLRPHFLGAIVLDQITRPTGHVESRWIIDGQQRLTTIQVILEVFADICQDLDQMRYYRALRKLTRNDDPLSDEPDEQFKVWPTNADQDHFRRVMLVPSPDQLKDEYGIKRSAKSVGHAIGDAYLFFHGKIESWLNAEDDGLDDRVSALYEGLREKVRMVVIDLGQGDDAQMIFETLNARGSPLLPSDLIKNLLFYRAKLENADLNALYDNYWMPFDDDAKYWRSEVGLGHQRRAKIDIYLQHYTALKTKESISVAHLYQVFREYAADTSNVEVGEHLDSVNRYSLLWRRFDAPAQDERFKLFFHRINEMDIRTAYPFFLELFSKLDGRNDVIGAALSHLESFLVRRMVCHLSTRGYNRLFIDLLPALDGSLNSAPTRIADLLMDSDAESRRWPADSEFRQSWLESPLYRNLRRSRMRMLLTALESELRSEFTESGEISGKLTIEHLMPQDWKPHWPLAASTDPLGAEIRREQLIHTIGNLTLLNDKLNPSVSNGPWLEKHDRIAEHSILALNKQLQDQPRWSEDEIAHRGDRLFDIATQIWPFPESGSRNIKFLERNVDLEKTAQPSKEGDSGGPSPRAGKYKTFFQVLIDALNDRHDFGIRRTAATANWISFPTGIGGIEYGLTFRISKEACVELWMPKVAFERVTGIRNQIERDIEASLEWENLSDRKGALIAIRQPGSIEMSMAELEEIREWMIDFTNRFRQILVPLLAE